jgi:hypothetical protein
MCYSCRYDAICRLGKHDPFVGQYGLVEGSVVVMERKSAAWLNEAVKDGWFLDGEVLGQIMLWKSSGMDKVFGPLAAVIVDIVTKQKTPDFLRVVVPSNLSTVKQMEKWVKVTQAEIAMWRATGVFKQNFNACHDRWGRCGLWNDCAGIAASGA